MRQLVVSSSQAEDELAWAFEGAPLRRTVLPEAPAWAGLILLHPYRGLDVIKLLLPGRILGLQQRGVKQSEIGCALRCARLLTSSSALTKCIGQLAREPTISSVCKLICNSVVEATPAADSSRQFDIVVQAARPPCRGRTTSSLLNRIDELRLAGSFSCCFSARLLSAVFRARRSDGAECGRPGDDTRLDTCPPRNSCTTSSGEISALCSESDNTALKRVPACFDVTGRVKLPDDRGWFWLIPFCAALSVLGALSFFGSFEDGDNDAGQEAKQTRCSMNTPSSTYTKTSRCGAGIMVWMTLGTPRIPEEDPLEAGRA
eukprot:CAMPEP_0119474838 /NCGR_PEP_ID=MMETSP1344-20130328/5939_1 /TAXON_ID=236787 /ORGANISM="Florenciella parvula, Strain CCMP2471" /LENGTH=316 /DNA_ID=CAMNT_0007508211 /DNA_START=435 /DNA_END=1383 /DNA_ORIENTATION=+